MILRQFTLLLKRILCKPISILFLLLLPAAIIIVKGLPAKSLSTNIVTGIYFEKDDDTTKAIVNALTSNESGFVFVVCRDADDMYHRVAEGKLDSGYYFPADFSEVFPASATGSHICLYVSPSTMFDSVTSEMVFDEVLKYYSPDIISNFLKNGNYTEETAINELEQYILQEYEASLNSDTLYKITTNEKGSYQSTGDAITMLPFFKLTGLIIFLSALFGLANHLKDESNYVYLRLPASRRKLFLIMNIYAFMLPSMIVGYISLLIDGTNDSPLNLAVHILIYSVICLIFALIYKCIFRRYKIFVSALPVLIIASTIFSPVFIDISVYIPSLKPILYLFAPTYF